MKISLYLEYYHFLGGILFKKIGTGLLSSYENQRKFLEYSNIPFTERFASDCDILQINTPWLKSLYLIKKAKRQNKKIIIWSHVTAEDVVGVFRFAAFFAPLVKKYLTYAYNLADIILSPTEYTKTLLIAYGISSEKIITFSNGVDIDLIFPDLIKRELYRKLYGLDKLTVGCVGLVIPRKGTDIFISLAKKFNDQKFIWYGKIYSSLLVKPLPKQLPSNLAFAGFVEDRNAAFNSLDIFLFPSFEENEGIAILEAAAVGLPILVRDIPVYEGWLIHNQNCLKAKTDEEFAQALKLLASNENLRKRLGESAKLMAESKSKTVLAKKLQQLYNELVVNK